MSASKTKTSRDLGLEVAAICGRHFFKLEHLHYGYWNGGLEVDIANLHTAQEHLTAFLISHIPDGVTTILDVGCGSGRTAKNLIDLGYSVDCVSPSPFLSERVRSSLGQSCRLFECPYEQLETEQRYDLVLFSESFQYISLEKGLEQTVRFLDNGGYLLICDIFKTKRKSKVGGGHDLAKFNERIACRPFELVTDIDITEQTAPSIDILDDAMRNAAFPALDSALGFMHSRHPVTTKLLLWRYGKKINKMRQKHFDGSRNSRGFKESKTYRLFLYRKTGTERTRRAE